MHLILISIFLPVYRTVPTYIRNDRMCDIRQNQYRYPVDPNATRQPVLPPPPHLHFSAEDEFVQDEVGLLKVEDDVQLAH